MFQIYKILLLALLAQASQPITSTGNYSDTLLAFSKSAQLRAYMFLKASPCDNFYDWACGHWKRMHPATEQQTHTSRLLQLPKLYMLNCAALLSEPEDTSVEVYSHDRVVDNQLKRLFKSCRNADTIAQQGFAPLVQLLGIQGGWPVITNMSWYENDYDWLRTVVQVRRKLNTNVLIGFAIVQDFQNPQAFRVKLGAPPLTLGTKKAYLSDMAQYVKRREQYLQQVAKKLEMLFPAMSKVWANDVAAQVLSVERKLAEGLPDDATLSAQELTKERLVKKLKSLYGDYINLSRYLQLIFKRIVNGRVYESPPSYFSNLAWVLQETPILTLANYTMWQALRQFDLGGSDEFCVRKVMQYFPHQLENMFYRNFTSRHIYWELQTEFQRVKYEFLEELDNRDKYNWITPYTLEQLQYKIHNMRIEVLSGLTEVNYFKIHAYDLRLSEALYQQNLISILQWQMREELNKILDANPSSFFLDHFRQPKYEYRYMLAYNPKTNRIEIPVTFLLSHFFWDPAYPAALKFSTLSFFFAQQLIYGLNSDNTFDSYAPQVWDASSQTAYAKRVNCFLQQKLYAADKFRGKPVNDPQKLVKIIADNGGVAAALRLYEKWHSERLSRGEPLPGLPDVEYTPREIFFISFAQLWCADYNPHWTFSHDELPEAVRVNGALANVDEFAKEFQCPLNSPMNAKQECVAF